MTRTNRLTNGGTPFRSGLQSPAKVSLSLSLCVRVRVGVCVCGVAENPATKTFSVAAGACSTFGILHAMKLLPKVGRVSRRGHLYLLQ